MPIESILAPLQNLLRSDFIPLFLQGIIIYIAILWIAIIIWVTKDVNNRSASLLFQVISILLVIFLTPLFGLLIYLIIRPAKTITEKYLEEREFLLLHEEEKKECKEKCPRCKKLFCQDHIFCPHCGLKVQKQCHFCHKAFNIDYDICPFCGKKETQKKKEKEKNVESE